MTNFLVSTLVSTIALTVLLNVVMRLFPGTSADVRARQAFGDEQIRPDVFPDANELPPMRLLFPWRQMLRWSLGVALFINVLRLFS